MKNTKIEISIQPKDGSEHHARYTILPGIVVPPVGTTVVAGYQSFEVSRVFLIVADDQQDAVLVRCEPWYPESQGHAKTFLAELDSKHPSWRRY